MLNNRLPVTVVTGFLGSGKTTLLRHLLSEGNQRLAVIVNEFGTVGLDGDLIKNCGLCPQDNVKERIVELNNGCLCCTVQEDFLPAMETLLVRSHQLDGIIIETSGLALPKPLLQALNWPAIRSKVFINGVVTLVDGNALSNGSPVGDLKSINEQIINDNSIDHLSPINDLFRDQLISADVVLISRSDVISAKDFSLVKEEVKKQARSSTNILPLSNGKIEPSVILGICNELNNSSRLDQDDHDHDHNHDHNHVDVISEHIRLETQIDQYELKEILVDLVSKFQILRIKGRCWLEGKALPLQIQMVGSRFDSWFEPVNEDVWSPSETGIDLVLLSLKGGVKEAIACSL
tara:strand:+ start:552 stop:1595 length:1044 start_codon:yes stop_codon:yes gene_type:complete